MEDTLVTVLSPSTWNQERRKYSYGNVERLRVEAYE